MTRPILIPMAAAAALTLFGDVAGGYAPWSLRGLTELGAFALVAWSWWWLLRHGLPHFVCKFLAHIEKLETAHREELAAEREQRKEDTERIVNAMAAINETVRDN